MCKEKKYLTREESKKDMVDILTAIDCLCKANNIKYSIAYGTLLGAIRHKGFIPWDDDIDICLFREDYDKLMKILKKQEDYSWLHVLDGLDSDGYYYPFAKAVDNRTIAKQNDNKTEHGIWVDIFPLDAIPADDNVSTKYLRKNLLLRNTILSMVTDFSVLRNVDKLLPKLFLNVIARIIGKRKIFEYTLKYNKKYEGQNSGFVGCLSTPYAMKEKLEKAKLNEFCEVEFEGVRFQAFKEWDYYLSKYYGSYMQLPPEEKRKNHSVIAWWQ